MVTADRSEAGDDIRNDVPKWAKEHGFVEADERFAEDEDK